MHNQSRKPSPIANIAEGIAMIDPKVIHQWCLDDPKVAVSLLKELTALIKAVSEHTQAAPEAAEDLPLDIKAAIQRETGLSA